MLKHLVFIPLIMLLLACRKDPEVPFSTTPNPCGSNKSVCTFPNVVLDGADSVNVFIAIPKPEKVKMTFFDRYGNVMADLLDSCLIAGGHQFKFDASMLPVGVNVCLIEVINDTSFIELVHKL